jgi:hypothetical protein
LQPGNKNLALDMNHPPSEENTKFVDLKFGGRVYYGRAQISGQSVGTTPLAIRIDLPRGHGDCPRDWFYLSQTSEVKLAKSLEEGFIPDSIWIECYRQAWLNLKFNLNH